MKKFLHHLFLPRESNNHRAKLLHHKSILILLILLFVGELFLITTEKTYTGVLGITANISSEELLTLTNQKRAENGLSPLTLNSELSGAASAKASDMFTKNYWAHVGPDGATPWGFIRSSGYEYIYAGENLARGFNTSNEVIEAWMASPGHRENMLSPNYKDVGFAIQNGTLTGDETVLVVEEFGSRSSTQAQAQKEVTAVAIQLTPTAQPTVQPSVSETRPILTPTIALSPVILEVTVTPSPQAPSSTQFLVAGFQSSPLIDSPSAKKKIVIGILTILLLTLIIDVILIERRKIIRHFSHNIDHIIFLGILLIVIIVLGKGAIL